KNMLERATPLIPLPAILDDIEPPSEPPRRVDRERERAERESDAEPGELAEPATPATPATPAAPVADTAPAPPARPPEDPAPPVPGRTPPSRGLLVLLALGTLALGVAAVVAFLRGRDRFADP